MVGSMRSHTFSYIYIRTPFCMVFMGSFADFFRGLKINL